MAHNQENYTQKYPNYYPNANDQYEDFYEDENQDFKVNFDEIPPDLQVPNSRLYAEEFPDLREIYTKTPYIEPQSPPMAKPSIQYRHDYNPSSNDYHYNVPQASHHHLIRDPKAERTHYQSTLTYRYPGHHYQSCPLGSSHTGPDNTNYLPKAGGNAVPAMTRSLPQGTRDVNPGLAENSVPPFVQNQEKYEDFGHNPRSPFNGPENFGDFCPRPPDYANEYEMNQEMYLDYKGRRYSCCGTRLGRGGVMRKHPITVKTPKYVSKNQVTQPVKKPSALCLPVITQPDPGLVKRKSKTHHCIKKTLDQSEPAPQTNEMTTETASYSAHQMHSEGDMNQKSDICGLENLLEQYENKVILNDDQGDGGGSNTDVREESVKEFSKFLKPRVPSTIKAREKMAKMKPSTAPLQPKMKLSLDKLLNRLQKCEKSESGEKLSEKSCHSSKKEEISDKKTSKHKSFNYENLTRKLASGMEQQDYDPEETKILLKKPSATLTTSLGNKRSSRLIKPLDDHCAIDLHRSKSYIVDLIDRALSKELGTVPRGNSSTKHDMTTKRAVTTISRHRQSGHKELCYEVTAALTDSFISNATAPLKVDDDEFKNSDIGDTNKLCPTTSEDVNYIKQLKRLRWGHIRHIQHEARKLADLEEFLEKCGEVEL